MATPIRIKRSAVSGKRPQLTDLQVGELALNTYDGSLFTERDTGGVGIATTVSNLTPWTESYGASSISYLNSVGIGTDNPTAKLDINGSLNVTGVSTFTGDASFNGNINYQGGSGDFIRLRNSSGGIEIDIKPAEKIHLYNDIKATFGFGNDLQIFHDNQDNRIETINGPIKIRSNLTFGNGLHEMIIANPEDSVELYYDGELKLETSNEGVLVSGGTTTGSLSVAGISTFEGNIDVNANADISGNLVVGGTINSGDNITITKGIPTLHFVDTNNTDYQIRVNNGLFTIRDTTNSQLNRFQIDSGRVYLPDNLVVNQQTTLTDLNVSGIGTIGSGGSGLVDLQYQGVSKFKTQSWGGFVYGSLVANGDLKVNRYNTGGRLKIGQGDEFTINHDTNNAIITEKVGNININASTVSISTNFSVGGDAEFNGNVSIAGTLTYEDVTNIDSVGLITARKGIISSGVVTATSFSGPLSGIATGADKVYVDESEDDDKVYNIIFTDEDPDGGNSYHTLQVDDQALTFNPGTNLFAVGGIQGTNYVRSSRYYDHNDVTSFIDFLNGDFRFVTQNYLRATINDGGLDISGTLNVSGVSTFSALKVGTGVTALTNGNVSIGGTFEIFESSGIANRNFSEFKLSDFSIGQHQNTGSYKIINSSTGQLIIGGGSGGNGGISLLSNNLGSRYLKTHSEGSVEIFHNNIVRFETTSSGVSIGGTTIITPASGGRLGIGTDDPQQLLHVETLDSTSRIHIERKTGGGVVGLVLKNSNKEYHAQLQGNFLQIFDKTTQTERLRIASTGNIGIETNNPQAKLHISGTGTNDIRIDTNATALSFHNHSEFMGFIGNDSGKLFINAGGTQDTLLLQTGGTERLRITGIGSVGIGTDNPDGQLHISSGAGSNGDCRVYIEADGDNTVEASNPFIIFKNDGGYENASVWCGNTDGGTNDNSLNLSAATDVGGGIRFFTSSTPNGWETADERARITSAGQLLINAVTARSYVDGAGYTQTPKLQVESNSNVDTAISLRYDSGAGADARRASFIFARTADGSAVSYNSVLGEVLFMGEGNNTLEKAASIRAEVDNTPGTNDMPGRLIFSTSADGSDSPTERLRITSTGNIGINSSAPQALLDIEGTGTIAKFGSSDSTYETLFIRNNLTGYPAIANDSSDDTIELRSAGSVQVAIDYNNNKTDKYFRVVANQQGSAGTEVFRVQEDGFVAIKNFSGTGLRLEGSGSNYQGMQLKTTDSSASQTRNIFIDAVNETGVAVANQVGSVESDGSSSWSWQTQPPGDRTSRRVERFRITGIGSVGINSTAPNTMLDVIASSANRTWTPGTSVVSMFERVSNSRIAIVAGASSYGEIDFGDSNDDNVGYIRYDHSDDSMSFRTDTDEQLRITSTGNVGIGTTNPTEKLDIHDSDPRIQLVDTDNNETVQLRNSQGNSILSAPGNTTFFTGGSQRVRINSDGNVGVGTNNPTGVNALTDNNATLAVGILTANTIHGNVVGGLSPTGDIFIGGDLDVDGHTELDNVNVTGFTTFSTGTKFFQHTPRIEMQGSNTATLSFVNATTGTTSGDGMLMGFSSSSKAGFINVNESAHGFILKVGGSHTSAERINISGVGTVSIRKGTTEEMLVARPDGAVELYYNNVNRLETKSWGVRGQGTIQAIGGRVETAHTGSQTESYSFKLLNSNGAGGVKDLIEIGHSVNNSFITGHVGDISINAPTVAISTNMTVGGIVTATSFDGALPIANDVNNRLITASGSGGLNAEGGLTYDGNTFLVNGEYLTLTGTGYKQLTAATTTNNSVAIKLQNQVKNYFITNVTGGVFKISEGSSSRMEIQNGLVTFPGNVSIGGTLTYEDVTNVDSIGVITAQNGLNVTSGVSTFASQTHLLGNVGIGTDDPILPLHISSTNPGIRLTDENQTTDNKNWNIGAGTAQILRIQAINDAGGGGGQLFDFYRDGNDVEELRGKSGVNYWFTINNSTKRVGIGTITPGELLDVYKTSNDAQIMVRTTAAGAYFEADSAATGYHGIKLSSTGTDKWFVGSYNSNNFQIKDGSAASGDERFTIQDGTGNIGIGTNNPLTALDIYATPIESATINTTNSTQLGLWVRAKNPSNTTGNIYTGITLGEGRAGLYAYDDGGGAAHGMGFWTGSNSGVVERLRITSAGKVGIGTVVPLAKLETYQSGTTGYLFRAMAGLSVGNRSYDLKPPSSDSFTEPFSWNTGNSHAFQVDGLERLRITSGGNVGIGTAVAPHMLSVKGTISKISGTSGIQLVNIANDGSQNGTIAIMQSGGVERIKLHSSGASYFNGGNVGIGSLIPTEKLDVAGHIKVDGGPVLETSATYNPGGALRITSPSGYVEVGAQNTSYAHFVTNRGRFYFGSKIIVDEGVVGSYNEDLVLATNVSNERLRIKNDTGYIGAGTNNPNAPLHVLNPIALGSTVGISTQKILRLQGSTGNAAILEFKNKRIANGSNWETSTFRIQRVIDVTEFGYIDFGTGGGASGHDIQFGKSTTTSSDMVYMHLDNTGNVGIGTDNPVRPLHIESSDCRIRLTDSDVATDVELQNVSGDAVITTNGESNLRLQTNNGERLRITSDGNVGIGTITPTAKLDVNVGSSVTAFNVSGSEGQLFSVTNNLSSGSIFSVNDISGSPSVDVDADGTIQLAPILPDEKVGIGTTNPDAKLHVFGNVVVGHGNTFSPSGLGTGAGVGIVTCDVIHLRGGGFVAPRPYAGGSGNKSLVNDASIIAAENFHIYNLESDGMHLRNLIEKNNGVIAIGQASTNTITKVRLLPGSLPNGNVELYNNTDVKLSTSKTGVVVTGILTASSQVAIGNNTPNAKLHIGPVSGDTTHHVYLASGNNDYGIVIDTQDYGGGNVPLRIFTRNNNNDTERIRVKQTGEVGIGTDDPNALIHLQDATSTLRVEGTNASIGTTVANVDVKAQHYRRAGYSISDENDIEDAFIGRPYGSGTASSPLVFDIHGSEALRITSDGKVGIGTDDPDELLHIFSASSNSKIVLEADNNSANNGIYWVDEGNNTQSEFYYEHGGNKQHLKVNGNGLEIYSKQTNSTILTVGHGSGYNDVLIPNGDLSVGGDITLTGLSSVTASQFKGSLYGDVIYPPDLSYRFVPTATGVTLYSSGGLQRFRTNPSGAEVVGVITATDVIATNNVKVGTGITMDATTGIITATQYSGGIYAKFNGPAGSTANINTATTTVMDWMRSDGLTAFNKGGFTNTTEYVTVPVAGLYQVTLNGRLECSNGFRSNVRFTFTQKTGPTSSIAYLADQALNNYIRVATGHFESSVNLTAFMELEAGAQIGVETLREADSVGTVTLNKLRSSITFLKVA